jgi:chromate transporter
MNEDVSLVGLGGFFFLMSFLAIGGATTALPDIYREFVEVNQWITGQEFVALIAIAQAAPGPNAIFASLLGWRVAGFPGAFVATIGLCGPSSVGMFYVHRFWGRFKGARWRIVVQRGLAPVAIGIVLASGFILVRNATPDWASLGVAIIAAVMALATRLNFFWILLGAAVLGVAGAV